MRMWPGIVMLVATTAFTPFQQPAKAAAPAGATGLCKDGTYEMSAVKSGACSGHKGVKTWYAAASAAKAPKAAMSSAPAAAMKPAAVAPAAAMKPAIVAPAPAAAMKPATVAPAPAAAMKPAAVAPAPMAAAAPKATRGKKNASAIPATAAAGGGPGLVWVNGQSKIYHCLGSTEYGRTKQGSYMTEAAAKAAGNRAARNKACTP